MTKFQITLKAARVNRGLQLKEVAALTGKSVDTILKYEKDSTDIPRDLMLALLSLYVMPADHIFFGKESDLIGIYREAAELTGSSP